MKFNESGDKQVSDQDKPRTWGDVIRQGDSGRYYVPNADGGKVQFCPVEELAKRHGIPIEDAWVGVRWAYLGCPPLTDPIPPEVPEPVVVTKVVRWEPTEEDARKIVAAMTHWIDSGDDHRRETAALIDAITDCQANIPDPEPTTPPDPIASIETLNEQVTRLSRSVQSHHCRLDTINARLAALESRDQTPSREWLMQAAEAEDASRSVSVGGLASDLGLYATPVPATPPPHWQGRLVYDFSISGSSPVVRGTRVTADHIVSLIVDGWTWSDILRSHPELTEDDLRACLLFATEADESLLTSPLSSVNGNQTPASNLIGKAPYNTPTNFDQALTVETPTSPTTDARLTLPLKPGFKEIEGFPLLESREGVVFTRDFPDSRTWLITTIENKRLVRDASLSDMPKELRDECVRYLQSKGLMPDETPPDPVIPLPKGCTEIEGYPLLCKDSELKVMMRRQRHYLFPWKRRQRHYLFPWNEFADRAMSRDGFSVAEIKQASACAIERIAWEAGLNVVVK